MQKNRLFKIIYHLLEKGKSTAPELAKKFEVSTRTIYRDLDTLSSAGIPVYAAQGKGGGISLLPDFVLDKSLLSDDEKEQILMALQGIIATGDKNADGLLSKLSGHFQSKITDWIEVDFSDWMKSTPGQTVFSTIKEAIFNRQIITFSYFGSNGTLSHRTVEPVKLVFKSKDWYLYGFCLSRNDFRFFKLNRIKDLETSTETFARKALNVPKVEAAIKNEHTIPVKLKFAPHAAFRVYDEFTNAGIANDVSMDAVSIHAVSTDDGGNLYVCADLPDNEVMYSYLLSFGDSVEVMEPGHVRRRMKEKLSLMLEKYNA